MGKQLSRIANLDLQVSPESWVFRFIFWVSGFSPFSGCLDSVPFLGVWIQSLFWVSGFSPFSGCLDSVPFSGCLDSVPQSLFWVSGFSPFSGCLDSVPFLGVWIQSLFLGVWIQSLSPFSGCLDSVPFSGCLDSVPSLKPFSLVSTRTCSGRYPDSIKSLASSSTSRWGKGREEKPLPEGYLSIPTRRASFLPVS
jgi:hypothetical protein